MGWWWAMIGMVSVGPVSDADVQPHMLGSYQTQEACEEAGKAFTNKAILFAKSIKKDIKVRAEHICLQQGEVSPN